MLARGCIALAILLLSVDATAQTRTLAGRWSASTMRTSWTNDPWGAACGPKPSATSDPGGIVSITQNGKEVSFSGLGRSFTSASCWEPISGVRIVSHSATERAWRTVCQSPAGDPRRSAVTTSLSATDDRIDFVEAGQFEFSIGNETCHAVMRRSRSFSLVEREGESRPVPAAPPAPAPVSPAADAAKLNCLAPGPASRVEVSPSRKLLRAGEEFTFRVRVLDKNGCALERPVVWKLQSPEAQLDVSAKGHVVVKPDAREGQTEITASVQERSVTVTVDVVSEARYQELLAAGTFDAAGETKDVAVTTLVSSSLGSKTTVAQSASQKRRVVFVWTIGALALALAVAALWMALTRRRPSRSQGTRSGFAEDSLDEPFARPPPPQERLAAGSVWVCPTCHEEYPAEQKFCALDGNRLVEMPAQAGLTGAEGGVCPVCRHGFDPGVVRCPVHDEELVPAAVLVPSPGPAVSVGRRICPVCGTIYGSETQFCGNDGASLVPIN